MNKKLLAATVLAALTLSTASVFAAAPAFSGDTRVEYVNNDEDTSLSSRFRLNVDTSIDAVFDVHARFTTGDYDLRNGQESVDGSLDQAYIGATVKDTEFRVGRQSLWAGKGMLMDGDSFNGAQVGIANEDISLGGFFGKAANGDKTTLAEVDSAWGNVNVGANYLKLADTDYYGLNFDTKVLDNAVLNVEYVNNTSDKADGYIAEVKIGEAIRKGEFDYALSYRNVEYGSVSDYSTDTQFNDSKGFRIEANYKVTNNATLNVKQDIAKDHSGNTDKDHTDVTFTVNF